VPNGWEPMRSSRWGRKTAPSSAMAHMPFPTMDR
jgi:hypothetical protein